MDQLNSDKRIVSLDKREAQVLYDILVLSRAMRIAEAEGMDYKGFVYISASALNAALKVKNAESLRG